MYGLHQETAERGILVLNFISCFIVQTCQTKIYSTQSKEHTHTAWRTREHVKRLTERVNLYGHSHAPLRTIDTDKNCSRDPLIKHPVTRSEHTHTHTYTLMGFQRQMNRVATQAKKTIWVLKGIFKEIKDLVTVKDQTRKSSSESTLRQNPPVLLTFSVSTQWRRFGGFLWGWECIFHSSQLFAQEGGSTAVNHELAYRVT